MFLGCQTRKFSHAKITAFTVLYLQINLVLYELNVLSTYYLNQAFCHIEDILHVRLDSSQSVHPAEVDQHFKVGLVN